MKVSFLGLVVLVLVVLSCHGEEQQETTKVLIDLSGSRPVIPSGYSISNTTLDFGRVEVFTVSTYTIQMEWPSPPGTESGNAGVVVRSKCSDDSLISFVSGGVMNDGVKSSATMTVQYHPQRTLLHEAGEGEGSRVEHAAMIIIGSIVAFKFPVFGIWTPSKHQLTGLCAPSTGDYQAAVTLRPQESWSRQVSLHNPTDQPYHVFGYETTNRNVRIMFLDQHDQVDQQRKNWHIPPHTTKHLGLLSTVLYEEGNYSGMFYLRLRSHPTTFALFYNFTVVAQPPRVVNLGTHTTVVAQQFLHVENKEGTSSDDVHRTLLPMGALERSQAEHELVVRPIEVHNYQPTAMVVADVLVKGDVSGGQKKSSTAPNLVSMTERKATTRAYPYDFHRPLDTLGLEHELNNIRVSMMLQRPCLRVVPDVGATVPSGARGTVGLAVLNLTACLASRGGGGAQRPLSAGATNKFVSAHRLAVDVELVVAPDPASRPSTRRNMDLVLNSWVVFGDLIPLRKKISSGHRASGDFEVLTDGYIAAVPTSSAITSMESIELYAFNAFRFPLQEEMSPTIRSKVRGVSVVQATSSDSQKEKDNRDDPVVLLGTLTLLPRQIRESLGDAPVGEIVLRAKIRTNSTAQHCDSVGGLSSTTPRGGGAGCVPVGTFVDLRAKLILSPLLVTLDGNPGSSSDALSMAYCERYNSVALLLHPHARHAYCIGTVAPLRQLSFGVHQVAGLDKRHAKRGEPLVLATQQIVVTNPHNLSISILEMSFSPNVSEGGRASSSDAYLRVAPSSLSSMRSSFPPLDISGGVESVSHLPKGSSMELELQLVCGTNRKGDSLCASGGQQSGAFTVRTVTKVTGRQPIIQHISVPVVFALVEEMQVSLLPTPVLLWSERRLVTRHEVDVFAVDRNVSIKSHFSSAIPLSRLECMWVRPSSSSHQRDESGAAMDGWLSEHPPNEPHTAYDVVWQRDAIPAGDFTGPIATIRYFPTHRSGNAMHEEWRVVAESSIYAADHRVGGLTSMALGLLDAGQDPEVLDRALGALQLTLGDADAMDGAVSGVSSTRSTAPFLTESEVFAFSTAISGKDNDAAPQQETCYLSLFGPVASRGPTIPKWATLITGQQGLPSFLNHVVDFGGLSHSSVTTAPAEESALVASEYITVVNAQASSVTVQPLLWSLGGSRLPPPAKSMLQEAVRQAFHAYRSASLSRPDSSRDAAASFRIPDEVWDRPSTTFELRGNATMPITLKPFESVVLGPIVYSPLPLTASDPSVTRVVDRDILILRNNHSGLDAVLVVGKIGKPVVHLGHLPESLESYFRGGGEVVRRGVPVPLPGDVLGDASATSIRKAQWNVSSDEVTSWMPRASGYPSWLDLYRHWRYAGSDDHAMQLSAHVNDRTAAIGEGWTPLPLRPDHLRHFVVRNEFDADGLMASVPQLLQDGVLHPEDAYSSSAHRGLRPAVRARTPVYFSKLFQVVNKGSFLLNVSSLTLGNGKCQDGELRIHPCILPPSEERSRDSPPIGDSDERWEILMETLNMTSTTDALAVGALQTNMLVPPRHAVAIELLWVPNFFRLSTASTIIVGHAGGSITVFGVEAVLPNERATLDLRFTALRSFTSSLTHAVVGTCCLVVVAIVGGLVARIKLADMAVASTAAANVQTATAKPKIPGQTVPPSAARTGIAGATKAQALQAKKARKDAWDLYHNQQKLQSMESRLSSGGAGDALQQAVMLKHASSSAADVLLDFDEPLRPDDDDATSDEVSSTRSSSVPPDDANVENIANPKNMNGSDTPTNVGVTLRLAESTEPQQQQQVIATDKSRSYESQRVLRRQRREQGDLLVEEGQNRERIVTEQLAFIGHTLLEWNSSSEVRQYHELKALQRLQEQARQNERMASEAADAAAKKAAAELQRREAEERRRQAEELVRSSDAVRAVGHTTVEQPVVAPAPPLPRQTTSGAKSGGAAARRFDRVHIPVASAPPPSRTTPSGSSPEPVDQVGGDITTQTPLELPRRSSFNHSSNIATPVTATTPPRSAAAFVPPAPRSAATSAPVAIDHDHHDTVAANASFQTSPSRNVQDLQALLQCALRGAPTSSAFPGANISTRLALDDAAAVVGTSPDVAPVKTMTLRDRLRAQVGMPPPVGLEADDEDRFSSHFGPGSQLPPITPPSTTHSASGMGSLGGVGIMGRTRAEEGEFIPQRLPSDFRFDEPSDGGRAATGAAIDDYSAFFGSTSQPPVPPSLTGTRQMWRVGEEESASKPSTTGPETEQKATFSLFGGVW